MARGPVPPYTAIPNFRQFLRTRIQTTRLRLSSIYASSCQNNSILTREFTSVSEIFINNGTELQGNWVNYLLNHRKILKVSTRPPRSTGEPKVLPYTFCENFRFVLNARTLRMETVPPTRFYVTCVF